MPHAGGGGGSSGGGFHSSGSSSHSGGSSVPRFDHMGRPHNTYYIGPGFYVNRTYVPYDRKRRRAVNYRPGILVIFFSLFFIFCMLFAFFSGTEYSESNITDYGIKKYEEVYDSSSYTYEYNLLVVIVAYSDNAQYDYITIVGDYVSDSIDLMFGNQKSSFGSLVFYNVPSSGYYDNLYNDLAYCLNTFNSSINTKYYSSNTKNLQVVNQTTFGEIAGKDNLLVACEDFYNITGYNISFIVCDSEDAYTFDIVAFIVATCVCSGFLALGIVLLVKNIKAVKAIDKASVNGEEAKFFEGEDDYETFKQEFLNKKDDYDWKKDF